MDKTFQIILAILVAISLIIIVGYFIVFCGLEDSSWITNILFYSSILLFIIQIVIALYFLCKLKTSSIDDSLLSPKNEIRNDYNIMYYNPKPAVPNYFVEKKTQARDAN